MRISFERTGGFAGLRIAVSLDLSTLSEETANELRQLVDDANFFELPKEITNDDPSADRFAYTVTVETEEREHTIHVQNAPPPDGISNLVNKLIEVARSQNQSASE